MKMMSIKMAMLFAGMGVFGYLYLKQHPEIMSMMKDTMKDMGKDVSRQVYNKLDDEM